MARKLDLHEFAVVRHPTTGARDNWDNGMPRVLGPLRFVLLAVTGWMNQRLPPISPGSRKRPKVRRVCYQGTLMAETCRVTGNRGLRGSRSRTYHCLVSLNWPLENGPPQEEPL